MKRAIQTVIIAVGLLSLPLGLECGAGKLQTGWFYGSKPINVCYNSLANFGVANAELESMTKRSFERWRAYFESKVFHGKMAKTEFTPDLNFKFRGKCKGEEDLILFFGAGPIFGNLQDLKSVQTLQSPLAYANKLQMRRDLRWSKGYVRFISHGEYTSGEDPFPNWKKPQALEAIMIHEIGHVLGFAHTPNTIMSAEVMEQVFRADHPADRSIDQAKQLVTCSGCREVYTLDSQAVKPVLLKNLGLNLSKPLQILRTSNQLSLTDGKIKVDFNDVQFTGLEKVTTLFSNFDTAFNVSSQTANIYATLPLKGEPKGVPVLIEYNSNDHQGGLGLRFITPEKTPVLSFHL